MLLGYDHKLQTDQMYVNETPKTSKQEKVLSITIENKLNFATDLVNTTKRSDSKFNETTRVPKYTTTDIFYSSIQNFCSYIYYIYIYIYTYTYIYREIDR